MKVLVVDDDPAVRKALVRGLIEFGFRVDATGVATEALGIMEHEDVEAVIADYHLADRTGVWLLQRVAELHPETLRILITGDPRIDADRVTAHGVCHMCRRKPVGPQDLANLLNGVGVEPTRGTELPSGLYTALHGDE